MLDALLNAADDASIALISVDIFDTLIFRDIDDPDEILLEVAARARNLGLISNDDAHFFVRQRKWAEKRARALSKIASGSNEVRLPFIYEQISNNPRILASLEEDQEVRSWFLNKELLDTLLHLQTIGKKIVFVSDMYLSELLISEYLKRKAVGLEVTDVRVSSQRRTSKAEGKAFDQLLSDYGCEGCNVLHIGDNFVDDIQMAASKGFKTYFLQKPAYLIEVMRLEHAINHGGTLGLSRLRRQFLSHNPALEGPTFEVMGACLFGPVLVGWARWIIQTCHETGITELYCLLREGEIVAETIKALDDTLTVKTLAISRRSSYLPIQGELSPEILFSLSERRGYCLAELAEDIAQTLPSELIQYREECLSSLVAMDIWQKILDWTAQSAFAICEHLNEQRIFLQRYLTEQGLGSGGHQAILDWGCGGSLLATISRVLKLDHGHFFLFYYRERALELLSRGQIHSFQPSSLELESRALAASPEVCEILLNQQLCSTIKYCEHNGQICPQTSTFLSRNAKELQQFKMGFDAFVSTSVSEHWLEQGVDVDCRKRLFTILYRLIEFPLRSEAQILASLSVPLSNDKSLPLIPDSTNLPLKGSIDRLWRNYKKGDQGHVRDCWWLPGFIAVQNGGFLLQQVPFSQHLSDEITLALLADAVRAKGVREVIVYGAGILGYQLGVLLMRDGISLAYYIDRRAVDGSLTLLGRPVENLEKIVLSKTVPIVIASRAFANDIYQALIKKNPDVADIVIRL
ncbi:MAG: hypothetical protein IPM37_18595 [Hahellaceae bacterium]|nr:hypothetical protein [Hahellaceae bacterium]